jgi:hypothetical protein
MNNESSDGGGHGNGATANGGSKKYRKTGNLVHPSSNGSVIASKQPKATTTKPGQNNQFVSQILPSMQPQQSQQQSFVINFNSSKNLKNGNKRFDFDKLQKFPGLKIADPLEKYEPF